MLERSFKMNNLSRRSSNKNTWIVSTAPLDAKWAHAELKPQERAPHGCWKESGITGRRHSTHKDSGKSNHILDTEAKEPAWGRPEDSALLMGSDLWTHLLATTYLYLAVNIWGPFAVTGGHAQSGKKMWTDTHFQLNSNTTLCLLFQLSCCKRGSSLWPNYCHISHGWLLFEMPPCVVLTCCLVSLNTRRLGGPPRENTCAVSFVHTGSGAAGWVQYELTNNTVPPGTGRGIHCPVYTWRCSRKCTDKCDEAMEKG